MAGLEIIVGLLAGFLFAVTAVAKKYIFNNSEFESKSYSVFETSIQAIAAIVFVFLFTVNVFTHVRYVGLLLFAGGI